jgi:hypothetical protein
MDTTLSPGAASTAVEKITTSSGYPGERQNDAYEKRRQIVLSEYPESLLANVNENYRHAGEQIYPRCITVHTRV